MQARLLVTVELEVEVEIERGADPQEFVTSIPLGFTLLDGSTAVPTKVNAWETVSIEQIEWSTILGNELHRGYRSKVQALIDCARDVINNWESGDLAAAVTELQFALNDLGYKSEVPHA